MSQNTIKEVIIKWQQDSGNLSHQKKRDHWIKNPAISGEYLIKFSIELKTVFCDDVLIPIELVSDIFQTTTLSESNTSDSKNDIDQLEKFLKDFDKQFQDLVIQKVSECKGISKTSDLLHMK